VSMQAAKQPNAGMEGAQACKIAFHYGYPEKPVRGGICVTRSIHDVAVCVAHVPGHRAVYSSLHLDLLHDLPTLFLLGSKNRAARFAVSDGLGSGQPHTLQHDHSPHVQLTYRDFYSITLPGGRDICLLLPVRVDANNTHDYSGPSVT
jgi:hypothetical protein